MNQLPDDFLIELAKSCIVSKDILEVVKSHLQYSYLPNEQCKHIFKYIFDYHGAHNAPPTIGLLSQNVNARETLGIIAKIRDCNVYDSKDQIINTLERYVKKARFLDLFKKTEEIFNSQDVDKAIEVMATESQEINNLSFKRKQYSQIFNGFDKRQRERQEIDFSVKIKIPTGIPALDYHTRGGIDRGTGLLGIARSGVGKSTFLRSLGMNAAFRGINVLHLASGDSTQKETDDGYDAWWTGVDLHHIKEGLLTGPESGKIDKARKAWLSQCGEVYTHVFKQFHSATIMDCRNILIDLLKECDIGLVLFDYLEKFDPGDGKRYGTNQDGNSASKKAVAEKIINIATEFNVAVATVTQASDIKKELWNNPNFVITRNDISNLKATIDPFAYCVTLNQTDDENDNDIMRIHEEKLRHYKVNSHESTYCIVQHREVGRFIDVSETKRRFWDEENKKIIRNLPKS